MDGNQKIKMKDSKIFTKNFNILDSILKVTHNKSNNLIKTKNINTQPTNL